MEAHEISCTQPIISFDNFEEYKLMAQDTAAYIRSISLNEDGIKEAKKTVANARKIVKSMSDKRIAVKNAILEPYKVFEAQVKEISDIIDQADSELRSEIRKVEEQEREDKEEQIRDIWDSRKRSYKFPQYIPDAFDCWMQPAYLNKTTSMKRIEDEMVSWMEDTEADVNTLEKMEDAADLLVEYSGCLNIAKSIEIVRARQEAKDRITEGAESSDTGEVAVFRITGQANIILAEILLNTNGIKFERK